MKRLLLLLLFYSPVINHYCHSADMQNDKKNPFPSMSIDSIPASNNYLEKSRRQKNTATWLLVGGSTVFSIGAIVGLSEIGTIVNSNDKSKERLVNTLMIIGVVGAVSSIPLYIAAGNNKKKARSVSISLKPESRSLMRRNDISRVAYPAISINIGL